MQELVRLGFSSHAVLLSQCSSSMGNYKEEDSRKDWSDLPDDLLSLIHDHMHHTRDYVGFGSVCRSWHSVYSKNINRHRRSHKLPLLMVPSSDDQTRSLYSLAENRFLDIQVAVPNSRFCRGSSYGWLITVTPKKYQVSLLDPFGHKGITEIQLPPTTAFTYHQASGTYIEYGGYLAKAVLSAEPASHPNDYVIMAIYGGCSQLGFLRAGDKAWTTLDPHFEAGCIDDIVYYKDQFYAVNSIGQVSVCNLHNSQPNVSIITPPLDILARQRYLVESAGELLQVARDTDEESNYRTRGFQVFKLDMVQNDWVKMYSLDGRALFIGDNSSFSLLASDHPQCKPNSIYFTDDNIVGYYDEEKNGIGPHDIGIFNLENGSFEPIYPTQSSMIIPPPIWVQKWEP